MYDKNLRLRIFIYFNVLQNVNFQSSIVIGNNERFSVLQFIGKFTYIIVLWDFIMAGLSVIKCKTLSIANKWITLKKYVWKNRAITLLKMYTMLMNLDSFISLCQQSFVLKKWDMSRWKVEQRSSHGFDLHTFYWHP